MKHLDDRPCCPHCGEPLNDNPWCMATNPDAAWPWWGKYGIYLIAVVMLAGLLHALMP